MQESISISPQFYDKHIYSSSPIICEDILSLQHNNAATTTTERSIHVVTRKAIHQMRYSRTGNPLADSVNKNSRRVIAYIKFIWIIET
jgi:hypothetical protein